MGVIQRQIEAQGVSTVSLSLYRPFTEAVKPPRALWVPFPFGRPLGAPNNRVIQRKVLFAALNLLTRENGPVLVDFELSQADQHLDARNQSIGRTCGPKGCSLDDALSDLPDVEAPAQAAVYDGDLGALCEEIRSLGKYHLAYRQRYGGRTQVGHSGAGTEPESIEGIVRSIHQYVMGGDVQVPSHSVRELAGADAQLRQNVFIRLCADDLKAYYLEARIAQRGDSENAAQHNDWLWLETRAGSLIMAARDRVIDTTDRAKDPNWMLARAMVPRGYITDSHQGRSDERSAS